MTSPIASVTPPYKPAPYLVWGPGAFLTSEELLRYFDGLLTPFRSVASWSTNDFLDFYESLGCINTAPQMVFERLIGNVRVFFSPLQPPVPN